jgi:hypothetical protein
MLLRKRKGFHYYPQETFKTGPLDIAVFFIVLTVFFWAFFIDSFRLITLPDGTTGTYINLQIFIGPIILIYEIFVLIVFEGKLRGRYLPWRLYLDIIYGMIQDKLHEGITEYCLWKKGFK